MYQQPVNDQPWVTAHHKVTSWVALVIIAGIGAILVFLIRAQANNNWPFDNYVFPPEHRLTKGAPFLTHRDQKNEFEFKYPNGGKIKTNDFFLIQLLQVASTGLQLPEHKDDIMIDVFLNKSQLQFDEWYSLVLREKEFTGEHIDEARRFYIDGEEAIELTTSFQGQTYVRTFFMKGFTVVRFRLKYPETQSAAVSKKLADDYTQILSTFRFIK